MALFFLIITIFCLVLVIIGIIPLKTGNLTKTLEGIAYGVSGIFFFYNMLSTGLSLASPAEMGVVVRIFNQVFFTAPTESLIFHVVAPSLGLLATYYFYRRFTKQNRIQRIQNKIKSLELVEARLRELYNQIEISNVKSIKYKGKKFSQAGLSREIFNTNNQMEILKLQEVKESKITINKLMFSKIQYSILSIVLAIILPNFIFATYHSFRSAYDFIEFWSSGIAFIYLGSGCWLTFIAIRYGWLPCVLSHALINIISIILAGVYV